MTEDKFLKKLPRGIKSVEVYFDGACNNTTDKFMGIGVACYIDKKSVKGIAKPKGVGTSNEAEWHALIEAMKWIKSLYEEIGRGMSVAIYGDSQLVVNQYKGVIGAENPRMIPFLREARKLGKELEVLLDMEEEKIWIGWIPRKFNGYADELSKKGREMNYKTHIGKLSNHFKNLNV